MSAIDLIVNLPPPDRNDAAVLDLSPSAYIQHPDTLALLCQKTSLHIGPQTQKNCRLEPAAIQDDRTILNYYDRVYRALSKEGISVRIPSEGIVNITLDNGDLQITAVEEEIKTYGERISELESVNTELKSKIATPESRIAVHDEARLRLFKANTLVDLVKKISIDLKLDLPEKLDETKDTTRSGITRAARSIKQQQLESFFKENGKTYGPQYFTVLQNMNKYIDGSNEDAHETSTEFAILLQSQYEGTQEYHKWGNLFPYVYNKSVKEIAESQVVAIAGNADDDDEEWGP